MTPVPVSADIAKITIVHEISPQTIHIPEGDKVKGIFVLLVSLKQENFDERNIALLSRLIPQNILLVLEYGGKDKLAVYYKKLMQTEWKVLDEQRIELTGLDLDVVWQNIIASIASKDIKHLKSAFFATKRMSKKTKYIMSKKQQGKANGN